MSDPARVVHAIAHTIGVNKAPDQPLIATLQHVLRARRMLLILDNFEHLLAAAPLVSQLLAAAPHLKVLATSREPLHLYGEQEYAVPPLALPDPERVDPQTLAECESAALFVQQARAVRADFELTAENTLDVAKICVRLEGLPLAIELAAARSKLLTPHTLLTRLTSRLDTLRGGAQDLPARQQTLYNTIAWSYNLLNAGEQMLFTRLAVFRGGCSLDAIGAVCGQDLLIDVWDGLESLVNKSLIQQKELPDGESRFIMLETLHEYAWVQLEASGEVPVMRRRHAEYFVALAERAEPELRLAQQQRWFRLLETEHENLRAVLQWSLGDGDLTLGVRMAGALYLYWFARGHHVEGRQWTEQLLARLDQAPVVYHAKFLFSAGHIAWLHDLDAARQLFAQALQISRDLGDQENTAWSLSFMSYAMIRETQAALALAEEGLVLFRVMNHLPGIAQALNIIGEIASFSGDDERARRAYEECLAVSQATGETRRIRFMYDNLTFLAQRQGDYARARQLAEQGLQLALAMNSQLDIADSLAALAGVIGVTGQPERAARLLGAWEAALERMGASVQPADQPNHDRNITAVRAQLDPLTFAAAWRAGRAMSLAQAVASTGEL
jgi:predicted ATPase